MKATVIVTLKNGVLDPQGKAIEHALGGLGFDGVNGVRQGKILELDLDTEDATQARTQIDDMCAKLLANPVIEDFRVEIDG